MNSLKVCQGPLMKTSFPLTTGLSLITNSPLQIFLLATNPFPFPGISTMANMATSVCGFQRWFSISIMVFISGFHCWFWFWFATVTSLLRPSCWRPTNAWRPTKLPGRLVYSQRMRTTDHAEHYLFRHNISNSEDFIGHRIRVPFQTDCYRFAYHIPWSFLRPFDSDVKYFHITAQETSKSF